MGLFLLVNEFIQVKSSHTRELMIDNRKVCLHIDTNFFP
jgi:hypothetical protein